MSGTRSEAGAARAPRKVRSDGQRSRAAILDAAARLATTEGIEGLSIARLADEVGMSKSGLFAHFGSKEELQLATIERASAIFAEEVTDPADAAGPGIARLRLLLDGFLDHVQRETYPGGCFFSSVLAEVDMRPGPVRDELVAFLGNWIGRLERAVVEARDEGSLQTDDPAQLVFELEAYLLLANAQYVVARSPVIIDRARQAIAWRLAGAGVS